jgi:gas vesicle protein
MTRGVLAAIIATLLISSTVSIEMKLSHVQEKRLKELDQEKWGHIILRFAELHNLAGGPFDDLKSAVEQLIADLGDRVNELDEEYNQNTLDHQSEVTRLQDEISDAQIDVASTDNLLNNVLYPAIDTLKAKIETLHNNINENNKYVEKITFERENGHAEYETRVSEQNDALSAVDECLNILEQVSGGNISFIQSKQLKNSLDKVAKTLNKGADEVIVKALIALASEEFADQAALLKVFNALKEVKQAIQDGLDQDHNDEARAQSQYDSE